MVEARGLALKGLRLGLKRKCPQESVGRRVRRSHEAWGDLSTGLTYSTQVIIPQWEHRAGLSDLLCIQVILEIQLLFLM